MVFVCLSAYAATVTSLVIPQYIQGTQPTNNDRVHAAALLKLDGLTANATYRFFNQVVISTDGATSNGAGNVVFMPQAGSYFRTSGPSLSSVGNYSSFTTDATGSYTGWFGIEPTGNATRFIPGAHIYIRIMLNNGAEGTAVAQRLTTTEYITVLSWGTDSSTATPLYGNWNMPDKKLVCVYDNVPGTGRPLSATYVESDGMSLSAVSQIALFYRNNVDNKSGYFGTIIPNNLPNGIRRLEFRNYDGTILEAATDDDGVWGSISTVNPSGGLVLPLILSTKATQTIASGTDNITITEPLQAAGYTFSPISLTTDAVLGSNQSVSITTFDAVPAGLGNPAGFRVGLIMGLNYTGNVTITLNYTGGDVDHIYYQSGLDWLPAINVIVGAGTITFTVPAVPGKGDLPIMMTEGDVFLPVVLSSFTAIYTAGQFVGINWITQTETDMSGYYIYRNENPNLNSAYVISPIIPGTNTSTEHSYGYQDTEVELNHSYYYWLEMREMNGTSSFAGPVNVNLGNGGTDNPPPVVPVFTELKSVFPNPFNPSTTIMYFVRDEGRVNVEIYNLKGQMVRQLVNKNQLPGSHRAYWDGKDKDGNACSSGIYYVRFTCGKIAQYRKMVLMK